MSEHTAENGLHGLGPCGLCGKDPATGYASEWSEATGEVWYCHGDDDESPTCYERRAWTRVIPPGSTARDTTEEER